ncbi:divergent polysaccharide deacetylase family protein [Paenibacillus lemnae]|nr:divergent polysaccharide deacetylase family protein [Paenibacillus lemnae]
MYKLLRMMLILGILLIVLGDAGVQVAAADDLNTGEQYKLAVIIDDFGNGQKGTDDMMQLPVRITVAVMPFLPTSRADAEKAHAAGHDVIIHMPMEPKQGRASWLGPGVIKSTMKDAEIREVMEKAIQDVPYAVGVNNHMGSKVTGDERIMSVVLDVCREHGLFFIDSKTNYHSVTGKIAVQKGLPEVNNHIFLDDVHTVSHVKKQLRLAADYAKKNKYCITIGHVGVFGERTAAGLKESIEELQREGIRFTSISELVMEQNNWSPDGLLVH